MWAASGCIAQGAPPAGPEGRVAVDVAALNLTGVGDVVWDIEVRNGDDPGAVVWQRRLTSTGYGDGAGSASYVGTCDAGDGVADNTVRVWVVGVYEATVSAPGSFASGSATGIADTPLPFQNPTTTAAPLEQTVTCRENADAPVSFDVALMRPAQQGFFDVAVSFDNLFCSAKVDCKDGLDVPLRLLFDANGARGTTVVAALACAGGASDPTWLYRAPLVLDCPDPFVDVVLDTTAGPGNAYAAAVNAPVFQYAVYPGTEQLTDSLGASYGKAYWNVAVGLDLTQLPAGCRLTTTMAASRASLDACTTPTTSAAYPVIDVDVTLTDGAGLACSHHPLDGADGGVATRYALSPETFAAYVVDGVATVCGPDGSSPAAAAVSCYQLHLDQPSLPDGDYWIDPDGDGGNAPALTTCDMTTDGGGWTSHLGTTALSFAGAPGYTSGGSSAAYFDGDWMMAFRLTSLSWNHDEGPSAWIQSDILGYQDAVNYTEPAGIGFSYFQSALPVYPYIAQGFQVGYRDGTGPVGRVNFNFPSFTLGQEYDVKVLSHGGSVRLYVDGVQVPATHAEDMLSFDGPIQPIAPELRLGQLYDAAKNIRQLDGSIADFRIYSMGDGTLSPAPPVDGLRAVSAAASCEALLTAVPTVTDGEYWIDPDGVGVGAPAYVAYCDMTAAGGGWTSRYGADFRSFYGASGYTDGGASPDYFNGAWEMSFDLRIDAWNVDQGPTGWIQADIMGYQDKTTYAPQVYGLQFGYFQNTPSYPYIDETFQIYYRDAANTGGRVNFYFPGLILGTTYALRLAFDGTTLHLYADGVEVAATHTEDMARLADAIHTAATRMRLGNIWDAAGNTRQFNGRIVDFRILGR